MTISSKIKHKSFEFQNSMFEIISHFLKCKPFSQGIFRINIFIVLLFALHFYLTYSNSLKFPTWNNQSNFSSAGGQKNYRKICDTNYVYYPVLYSPKTKGADSHHKTISICNFLSSQECLKKRFKWNLQTATQLGSLFSKLHSSTCSNLISSWISFFRAYYVKGLLLCERSMIDLLTFCSEGK